MRRSLARHWEYFFHRSVHPHSFAILRIGFALFLLLYWYTQWRDAPLFSAEHGVYFPRFESYGSLLTFAFHPPLWFVYVFLFAVTLTLTALLVGYRTRTAALLLLLFLTYYHFWHQWLFSASYYRLFQFSCMVFLLPGADAAFSHRIWKKYGSVWPWEPISILPLRFFALQLTATYLGVGWQKLILPGWDSGKILYHSFIGRWGTPFAFFLARTLPAEFFDWLIRVTVLLEITMPFGLWIRKVQWIYFLGGFIFHTMITLTLGIWWFQIMVPMYIVFLPTEEVFSWLRMRSGARIPLQPSSV